MSEGVPIDAQWDKNSMKSPHAMLQAIRPEGLTWRGAGEFHEQMVSFKVLFENVETLRRQNVNNVYFEGLIDMPQGLYDDGNGILGQSRVPRTNPSFAELRQKLEASGISVMPLDHYYLTRHKSAGSGSVRRLEEFNYYAAETIQANSCTEKWVALLGSSHTNTSELDRNDIAGDLQIFVQP